MRGDRKPNQWIKEVLVFVVAAFITGLLTAGASVAFSYLFPDIEPDTESAHQARVETLLQDISLKLDGRISAIAGDAVPSVLERTVDDVQRTDANPNALRVEQGPTIFIGRAWGLGAKRYSTSLQIVGLGDANLSLMNVQYVVWDINSRSIKTMGLQPLYLKNITNSMQLNASLWFDEKLLRELGTKNPFVIAHAIDLSGVD